MASVWVHAEVAGESFSWRFAHSVETGHFVDGSPWIVAPGHGIDLIEVQPQRQNNVEVEDQQGNTVLADINQTVINPSIGTWVDEQDRLVEVDAFGWDSRGAIRYGLGRRYDASLGWDAASPIRVYPGDIISSARSRTEQVGSTAIEAAAVLTVLAAPPPADAFRPGMLRRDDRRNPPEFFRLSDVIDLSPHLISVPDGDLFDEPLTGIPTQFQAEHLAGLLPGPSIMNMGRNDGEGTHGYRNNAGATYSADIAMQAGDLAVCALAAWLSESTRESCLIRFLQRSIDYYEAVLNGLTLAHDGGMSAAYGMRMAVAGALFDHAGMRSMDQQVHNRHPKWYFSDYGQIIFIGDADQPQSGLPQPDDIRFMDWRSDELDLYIDDVAVVEAGDGWLRVADDFVWPTYRAVRAIRNVRFQISEGPGAGDTIYVITDIDQYFDANGGPPSPWTPNVAGGRLQVKPEWTHGAPGETSRLRVLPLVEEDAGQWTFKGRGVHWTGAPYYSRNQVTRSPDTDYASVNVGAYLTLTVALNALNAQNDYSAGMDQWMMQIGEIPGYGEFVFNNDRSRFAARPGTPDRQQAFLGGLWREQVLQPNGRYFVYTDGTTANLPVPGTEDPDPDPPGATGTLEIGRLSLDNEWLEVSFVNPFAVDPVVILGPAQQRPDGGVVPIISEVTKTGFRARAASWPHLAGDHEPVRVSFLAIDPDVQEIGGLRVVAGRNLPSKTREWRWQWFPDGQRFSSLEKAQTAPDPDALFSDRFAWRPASEPLVFISYEQPAWQSDPVAYRLDEISGDGFSHIAKRQRADASLDADFRTAHFLAIEQGHTLLSGSQFAAFTITADQAWQSVDFLGRYRLPELFVQAQSYKNNWPMVPRFRQFNQHGVELRMQTDASDGPRPPLDMPETLGVLLIGSP